MKQKSELFKIYKVSKILIDNSFRKNIKSIRSNNGGEYIKRYFQQYCESKGIQMEHFVPYTSQHNSMAERKN